MATNTSKNKFLSIYRYKKGELNVRKKDGKFKKKNC